MVGNVIENHVVTLVALGKILVGVINDMIRAERSDHIHVSRAADPVTSAPNDLAICTANVPTPPEAPLIRSFCPADFPLSRQPVAP